MRALVLLLSLSVYAEPPKLRLPETSKPLGYRIELTLDPKAEAYSGVVEVDIEILKPTREIWLNAEGLQVTRARLGDDQELRVQTEHPGFLGLTAGEQLKPGPTKLRLEFSSKFELKNSQGVFRIQEAGDWYVYTQFEPINARRGFPCYDEPAYKVPWELSIRAPKGMKAVANTPLVEESADGEWTRHRFAKSKPMPSYLVAFAVGPFEFVDAGKAGMKGTPLRIVTPKGKATEARGAVEITGKVLEEVERYFGIPYPYEKLDSIAIPLTFGFSAMENAGLITYEQTVLLSPPASESDSFRQYYLSIAAHEIAHQWFGNLVTPEFWDDIWLNEGFAEWMQFKITHKMRPDWKHDVMSVANREFAKQQDSLISARSIRQPIQSDGDIVNAFDGITYVKGASVIGMFEQWMGERDFQEGVRRYLKRHEWRNATASMFLDSISAPGGKSVSASFNTFLNQPGVPLLSLSLKCDGQNAAIEARQERFLPVGSKGSVAQSWQMPVCVKFEREGTPAKQCVLMTAPRQEIALTTKGCPAWINGNAEAAGYYRVAYEGANLRNLAERGVLTEAETVDLLDNTLALATAGKVEVAEALRVGKRFSTHPEPRVVARSFSLIGSFDALVADSDRPAFTRLVQEGYGAYTRKLGWTPGPSSTPLENEIRRSVVPRFAQLGADDELQSQALTLGRRWLKDRKVLPTDVAGAAMKVAAERGGVEFFDEVTSALKSTQDRAERGVLITALGSTNDPVLAKRSLEMVLNRQMDIREAMPLLFGMGSGNRTRQVPYEFVRSRFDELIAIAPSGSQNLASYLPFTASPLCDASRVVEVRGFFSEKLKGVTGAERSIENAVEAMELCSARKAALAGPLHEALQSQ